jgi:hypothetical protein
MRGLLVAKPQHFGRLEPGQRRVAGYRHQVVSPDRFSYLPALPVSTLVIPEQGRPDDPIARIEEDGPMHLAGKTYSRHLSVGRSRDRAKYTRHRFPPVFRMLLRPARPWRQDRMLRGCVGHHIARGVDGQRSNAAGSDVEADYNAHRDRAPD